MSYSDEETNRRLAKLEKKLKKEYTKAYKGLDESYQKYLHGWDEMIDGKIVHHKGIQERWEQEYKAYQKGEYTEEQWKNWQIAQVARGKRWETIRDEMAQRITDTNLIAEAYINDETPGIYALNYNYAAYEAEQGTGAVFNIYNEQAVKSLMNEENHVSFRTVKVNPKRDYAWNQGKINSALLGGILQGKPIEKIADNFLQVMGSNQAAAIRNARTAYTSAQNGGRQECFDRTEEMGIEVQKQWVATLDDRTRDSHQSLDGVRVPNGDKFPNGCEYPGDPKGAPKEVYNCRCAVIAYYPKYDYEAYLAKKNGTEPEGPERAYKINGHRQFDKFGKAMTAKNMTYKGTGNSQSYKEWLKGKK